ncbi:hypothetical protein [Thermobifida halotolerans]|nr:hypothetical protein [Thermobifida halotolerans]
MGTRTVGAATVQYLPSDQVRDTLGRQLAWVRDTSGILVITDAGIPDGALVPPDLLTKAGLTPVREQGVREARARWGATRADATDEGPQGLTHHRTLMAVLVDQPTVIALTQGLPVLAFTELTVTGSGIVLSDGTPVVPGTYALRDGKVVHIDAPEEREWDMSLDEDILYDDQTPDDVIRSILDDTAAHVAGVLMRRARATQDTAAKQEVKDRMQEVWKLKSDLGLSRQQMVEHILRLRDELRA